MKKMISCAIVGSLVLLSSCKQQKVELKTEDQKTLYTVGFMMGSRMAPLSLTDDEIAALAQGLKDSAKNATAAVKTDDYRAKVPEFFKAKMSKVSEQVKKDGDSYMDKFLKEAGAMKLDSGLAYKITKEGTGAMPKAEDNVKVHYHGTLVDGTVFDSSKDRGEPVTFPLNRVIKGWTEGLQKVKTGGSIKLVIPSALAYGDGGVPPKIPGGATLVFEVELLEIVAEQAKPAKK